MAVGGMKERKEHFKTPYRWKSTTYNQHTTLLWSNSYVSKKKVGLLSVDLKPLTFPQRGLQGS